MVARERERQKEEGGVGVVLTASLVFDYRRNLPGTIHTQSVPRITAGREPAESEYIKRAASPTPEFPSLI